MSDRSSNMEIQDVLSSIRRLVSEDKNPMTARDENADPAPRADEPQDKLVLTPAHRIQDDAAVGDDTSASVDGATLEDTIAELEAAVANTGGDFEPDGSEVGKADRADADPDLERAFEDGFAVDVGGDEGQESALSRPVTSGQVDEGDKEEDTAPELETVGAPEDEANSADDMSDPASEDPVADDLPTAVDMPSREQLDTLIVAETAATAGAALATRRLNLSAGDLVQGGGAPWGRTDAPKRDDSAPNVDQAQLAAPPAPNTTTIDIEAEADAQILREIVADIVRQELQGPLGERITRSVRMLVRREINRALESRDFE